MLARLNTFSLLGIEAVPVEVEVDVSPTSMPRTILVGLPDTAVRESTHRIERAMVNSGFLNPSDRIVINLAPADLPKQASTFDLPITLGLLIGSGQLDPALVEGIAFVGELSLQGNARPARGALSMAIEAARQQNVNALMVPMANAQEAAVVEAVEVIAISSLAEAAGYVGGRLKIEATPSQVDRWFETYSQHEIDFSDVRGQESAKRSLMIAAAGAHNLLMLGPPGSGKTMLAKRMGTILPDLTASESIETTRIYSALGRLDPDQPLMARRPFRSPHHTISDAGLVGGGSKPVPGEISMAHNGILFLDELPEFNRRTLEVMRQPMEDGEVTISRALRSTTFPADFSLIAALNPCPCGYRGDPRHDCQCSQQQVERYMAKISGPLLDRIDIHIEVPAVSYHELSSKTTGTSSEVMRGDVLQAREIQEHRFRDSSTRYNAQMSTREIRTHCPLQKESYSLLKQMVSDLGMSARAYDKVLRVARTISDLQASPEIKAEHVQEAINYRLLDRNYWQS